MKKPIATHTRTNEIMEKYGLFTKKNYGQNFIVEPKIVEKIACNSMLDENTAVIEIGPGIGALTEQLAKIAKTVWAYEIDTRLIDILQHDSLVDYSNVKIIHQDFLEVNVNDVVNELKKSHEKVVVAANLPYYITTPILFKLFESEADISYITVMMQKEVADRFSAQVNTKDYNALSVIVQYSYSVKSIMKIPKTIFHPKPNVDSSVIQFHKKENMDVVKDKQQFFGMVKGCFKQRRKTILNNYSVYLNDKTKANALLSKANIDYLRRSESVTLEEFIQLYEVQNEN